MRVRILMRVLALLVIAAAILPVLPVAAQSSCSVSTRFIDIRLRAGHTTSDRVIALMRPNRSYDVTETYRETLPSGFVRTWYHLAPGSASEDVWVGGNVVASGNCANISVSSPVVATTTTTATTTTDPAAAPTTAAPTTSGVVLPQSGTWSWTTGGTFTVTCPGLGSVGVATSDVGLSTVLDVNILSSADSFTVDGVAYTRDAAGTWQGYYSADGVTGTVNIRVNTPTFLLADLIITDSSGCTGTVPFSGVPKV